MESFGKSQSVTRKEDIRFLTGKGRYNDDIAPPGAAKAFFLRSPVAHATFSIEGLEDAQGLPGVLAIYTIGDLDRAGVKAELPFRCFPNRDGSQGAAPPRPALARDRVRFVGEAVACIVATDLASARDAADAIWVDYEDLPASMKVAPAAAPDIHPEAPDNVGVDFGFGDEAAVNKAFKEAAHHLSYRIEDNRVMCASMEPRAAFAEWDGERLHLSFGGQNVWGPKTDLAAAFGLDLENVRVTIPDVGGGFGTKAFMYPEYYALCHAARALGRPVSWASERTEAMLTDNGARDLTSVAELALDSSHRITGYRVRNLFNIGAYNSFMAQGIQTELFTKVMPGVYDIPAAYLHSTGIYTNTTQVDAYRGAGRPEAIYVLERAMDYAAEELGLDPWEFRRKNFVSSDQMPFTSATGEIYDVGDFSALLDKAMSATDKDGFEARRREALARGKLRGLGLCCYIESILGQPGEHVDISFDDDGGATIKVGTVSNGQGHETVMVQFLSDQTGIPADKIRFVQADSDLIPAGGGTGGSRSVTVQNNVTLIATRKIIGGYAEFLADVMGVEPGTVTFDDERFRAEGSNLSPTMLEAAQIAREAGRNDLLRFREQATLPARSFPNGAHVAEVEIDPDTGETHIARYTVVDDFGNLINPMLAEGQVHGGVVQGLGQALREHVVYDDDGQLLTATFMDYAVPRAKDVPSIDFSTLPVPSTANPLGMKGCGEAGTVGALAAVANAMRDAMAGRAPKLVDMPFTPLRVWEMLQNGPQDIGNDNAN